MPCYYKLVDEGTENEHIVIQIPAIFFRADVNMAGWDRLKNSILENIHNTYSDGLDEAYNDLKEPKREEQDEQ